LKEKVDFEGDDNHLKAIDLPKKNQKIKAGLICVVIGWGVWKINRTDDEVYRESAEVLQKVSVPIVDQKVCEKKYEFRYTITESMICAKGVKNKGTCFGDSGSPLQCLIGGKYLLVGIVSGGQGCDTDYPNIYTRVNYYLSWIKNKIDKNLQIFNCESFFNRICRKKNLIDACILLFNNLFILNQFS
jgi:secreted trypsin-like serine protease